MTAWRSLRTLVVPLGFALASLPAGTTPADAAFPGSNGVIVFAEAGPNGYDLYVRDGLAITRLTQTDGVNDIMPSFSADGTRIAWSRGYDIWTMKSDGSSPTALITSPATEGGPAFSPSGKRIVFSRNDSSGDGHLWLTSSTDGSTPHKLGVAGGDPSWSPSGRWIAFERPVTSQGCICIFKVHPDGTGLTNLSKSIGATEDHFADWSPDGSHIVLAHALGDGREWIVTMRADGTRRTAVVKGTRANKWPAYSPSGRKIVFSRPSATGAWTHLATVPAGGGTVTLLTTGHVTDLAPTWQPT